MPKPAFAGVYPMLFAFFGEGGALDEEAIRRQTRAVLAAGAHGVAVLGLASEANKMSTAERLRFIECVQQEIKGKVPLSVTVSETSAAGQIAFSRQALELGASWLVLQPPPVKGMTEASLAGFFAEVAAAVDAPIGLQLAPDFLSGTLSAASLSRLVAAQPNISILKVEMPALEVARLIEDTRGAFAVFNGRAGLDMPDSIAAGCVGFVPGAESTDRLVRIYEALTSGQASRVAEGEQVYKELAPLLSFLMLGIDNFLVYGKTLMARRLGFEPSKGAVRSPTAGTTAFGLTVLDRWSRNVGRYQ
jgi:2-keto-3-deoxy-L-arabinonate dehydratase